MYIFSEFENKMLKVSKIGLAKTEHTHMRKVDATCPFRVAWLSIVNYMHVLHISPLNKKKASAELCHKCSKIRLGDRKSSFEVVAP